MFYKGLIIGLILGYLAGIVTIGLCQIGKMRDKAREIKIHG